MMIVRKTLCSVRSTLHGVHVNVSRPVAAILDSHSGERGLRIKSRCIPYIEQDGYPSVLFPHLPPSLAP
ncbi:metallophosphoesterase [Histoplasma capsulatum G186AR]|uniref:Metallophosphoesterase n=1 Tax=Ajellomyces capsulatus TaxID=5037 RepID=A0A8H7YP43_AJECA|nr:metallophosphoesterase [Histoplasma capsulatum]QSS73913.1 metallophosphoesterase [Histoplasma capsulatum G186AR]